jgi:hypothetical protein
MSKDLAKELSERSADSDVLHQTVRYCVAELTDDLPPEEMIQEMLAAGAEADIEDALDNLRRRTDVLDEVCLFGLSALWDTPANRSAVTGALTDAQQKLPVIEIGVVAASALYVIYLLKTGGVRRSERRIVRRPDGSFEYKEVTEYTDASSIIGEILNMFSRKGN